MFCPKLRYTRTRKKVTLVRCPLGISKCPLPSTIKHMRQTPNFFYVLLNAVRAYYQEVSLSLESEKSSQNLARWRKSERGESTMRKTDVRRKKKRRKKKRPLDSERAGNDISIGQPEYIFQNFNRRISWITRVLQYLQRYISNYFIESFYGLEFFYAWN